MPVALLAHPSFAGTTIGEVAAIAKRAGGTFNIGTSDAKFLFGSDIEAYLAEIRKRAVHMRTARQLLEKPQVK